MYYESTSVVYPKPARIDYEILQKAILDMVAIVFSEFLHAHVACPTLPTCVPRLLSPFLRPQHIRLRVLTMCLFIPCAECTVILLQCGRFFFFDKRIPQLRNSHDSSAYGALSAPNTSCVVWQRVEILDVETNRVGGWGEWISDLGCGGLEW